jgi:uncharacterized protein YecT (DUF1311 family)
MKLIYLICAFNLPALAFAATTAPTPSERELREECSNKFFSQLDVRDCLAEKAKDSLKALQQAEKEIATTLSKWDEQEKFIIQSKTKLSISNKSFLKYRNEQCEFMTSLSGGGTISSHEMGRFACIAELNYRRAAQLQDTMSDVPVK